MSGAEIASICQQAGMLAVRVCPFFLSCITLVIYFIDSFSLHKQANRYVVLSKDLEKAYSGNVKKTDLDLEFYR